MPVRTGGSYRRDKAGSDPRLVARTDDHPEGNRARPAGEPGSASEAVPEREPEAKPAAAAKGQSEKTAGTAGAKKE